MEHGFQKELTMTKSDLEKTEATATVLEDNPSGTLLVRTKTGFETTISGINKDYYRGITKLCCDPSYMFIKVGRGVAVARNSIELLWFTADVKE